LEVQSGSGNAPVCNPITGEASGPRSWLNRDQAMIWSHPHDTRFFLVLVVGLVGLLALAFRLASAPSARSKALLALRGAAIGLVVLILLNPTRVQEDKHFGAMPTAVFLLDESRSMSLEAPKSRATAVDEIIRAAVGLVPGEQLPPIQRFGFGRDLSALSDSEHTIHPQDEETRLVWALEQLPPRFGEALPFGVFVFSDGRSTETETLDPTARAYRALGVPVHVVPVGDVRISGDVAVQDIDAPRDARPGTRVPVRVTLRSRGYPGQRTELKIRSAANPQGDALATLPVTLVDGEGAHELVIETDRAKGPLTVEVSPLPHEVVAANNFVPFQITSREEKLRVIYMEGTPLPEYRYLQDALQEDPNIRCLSMAVDNQYGARQRLYRVDEPNRGFPTTREELLSYDVVICSDIALPAFTPQQLEWTVELVNKRGGGFAMIGGNTSFGSGRWDQTIWDGLIPVDMSGRGGPGRSDFYYGSFRVIIPPGAIDHPIWRIVDDKAKNREVLARMPVLFGTNLIDRLKPAATALGLSDRALPGSGVVTVFSCQTFGRGRTFAMSSDTTRDWGADFERIWGEGDNRYFRKFWRNVVRWLAENVDSGNRRLRVETDKVLYRPGQAIQVTARAFDEKLVATDRYRVVARLRSPTENETLPFDASATNLVPQLKNPAYRGKLTIPQAREIIEDPGSTMHKLVLDVATFEGDHMTAKASLDLQVIDDPAEFRDPRPDPAQLAKLAEATAGRVIHNPGELATLLAHHPDASVRLVVTRWPMWDTPLLWMLLLCLLAGEWILRRLKGLA
jgi:uncharacterized membrane protein